MLKLSFFILLFTSFSITVNAAGLSNEALFTRCYSHLTRSHPDKNSSLYAEVKSGSKSPVAACMQVLSKANLTASNQTTPANTADQETRAVLQNLHSFHSTWFSKRDLSVAADPCIDGSANDLFDSSTPALFVTRSLLNTNIGYSSIVTSTSGVQPIRENTSPGVGPYTGKSWIFHYLDSSDAEQTWNPGLAQKGHLLGVRPATQTLAPPLTTYEYLSNSTQEDLNLNVHGTLGGGLIGTQTYLLANIAEQPGLRRPQTYASDGGVHLPRRLAKAVFNDLLCRELPVIRSYDARAYVKKGSSISFRKSNSCTQCHASMDRMAMGGRAIRYASTRSCSFYANPGKAGGHFMYRKPASLPAASTKWPSEADTDFYKRPEDGVLYYRNYEGKLVRQNFQGLNGLGSSLADQKDLYICAAKRYFKFFTGIEVNTSDVYDPLSPVQLSNKHIALRNFVVQLGTDLKEHQNLQTTIREIMSSPVYSSEDYQTGDPNE